MGECISKPKNGQQGVAKEESQAHHAREAPAKTEAAPAQARPAGERAAEPSESAQDGVPPQDVSSAASSEIGGAAPRAGTSMDRQLQTAASSDDSRTPAEASSPLSSLRRTQPPTVPAASAGTAAASNASLTESNLHELNQASSVRRGKPSSTGGTTANTRPEDAPDMTELSEIPEAAEVPHSPAAPEAAGSFVSIDAASATPPPVAEGLPVVSLQDIAVMEQKQGRRGRRRPSRRGSTTASHASLSAIPENVEITPLHARSERSDSMRPMGGHPVSRLADVQELDVRLSQSPMHRSAHVRCSAHMATFPLLPGVICFGRELCLRLYLLGLARKAILRLV